MVRSIEIENSTRCKMLVWYLTFEKKYWKRVFWESEGVINLICDKMFKQKVGKEKCEKDNRN